MLELSDKTLSMILDSAIDTGIITLDPQGCVVSWNAGAVRLLGWTEAE
jgi:PAS domain-containing protein